MREIDEVLTVTPAFDELKGGIVEVLGKILTSSNPRILEGRREHEILKVIKRVAEALETYWNHGSWPLRDKAKAPPASMDRVGGVLHELFRTSQE